eukprot:CAMPEP_0172564374 /NCGR_PEP_ID=MMETSP1067-20121228/104107_1 /TAXON_ID=265564 ORGANISM="Thalassiosira punctigera, Strain Tpunct2005C2" /NCGR_SAMPLE_ID=MMETSP1067 /ASSEMBLY_ACC=CAM_ASM_000444 /LENGTH=176 /DNA_ID=CAMNT_0013355031 /DNA_START=58 /DNA_END=585 /DNA_ORIENTATION=-
MAGATTATTSATTTKTKTARRPSRGRTHSRGKAGGKKLPPIPERSLSSQKGGGGSIGSGGGAGGHVHGHGHGYGHGGAGGSSRGGGRAKNGKSGGKDRRVRSSGGAAVPPSPESRGRNRGGAPPTMTQREVAAVESRDDEDVPSTASVAEEDGKSDGHYPKPVEEIVALPPPLSLP